MNAGSLVIDNQVAFDDRPGVFAQDAGKPVDDGKITDDRAVGAGHAGSETSSINNRLAHIFAYEHDIIGKGDIFLIYSFTDKYSVASVTFAESGMDGGKVARHDDLSSCNGAKMPLPAESTIYELLT